MERMCLNGLILGLINVGFVVRMKMIQTRYMVGIGNMINAMLKTAVTGVLIVEPVVMMRQEELFQASVLKMNLIAEAGDIINNVVR